MICLKNEGYTPTTFVNSRVTGPNFIEFLHDVARSFQLCGYHLSDWNLSDHAIVFARWRHILRLLFQFQ